MAKSFDNLRKTMSPASRARSEATAERLLAEMPLQELRHARRLSQEQLAQTLHVKQASISKMERRADMYIGTLRRVIEAMGGDLDIRANFPDGAVRIRRLGELDSEKPPSR
jgi:transcriptional regulator with XRE-family HTH domain